MIRYRNSPEIVDALDRYLLTGTLSARVVQGGQQHLEADVSSRVSCSLSVRYAEGRAQGFSPRRAGANHRVAWSRSGESRRDRGERTDGLNHQGDAYCDLAEVLAAPAAPTRQPTPSNRRSSATSARRTS